MDDSVVAYASVVAVVAPLGATTWIGIDSLVGNSARIWSMAARAGLSEGRTRSSGRPKSILRNGAPRNSNSAMTDVAIGRGRFITAVATPCQNPSPTVFGSR